MKAFVCKPCGYVVLNGVVPEKCPICHAPKTAFEEKEGAIKLPQDPKNKTELEKKHVPVILVLKKCGLIEGCVDVHVKMGEILHPMLPEHFIMWIDFYLDKNFISRMVLTPDKLNPAAGLHLKATSGVLNVVEFCNLHGTWMSEAVL